MKTYTKLLVLSLALLASLGFVVNAYAMTPALSLYSNGANSVTVNVSGADPYASVVLYYNLSYGTQSTVLGTTNASGYSSTTLSNNSYGMTSGALAYVIVNGQQSPSVPWPSYYNSTYYPTTSNSALVVQSLTMSPGNSITLSSSGLLS